VLPSDLLPRKTKLALKAIMAAIGKALNISVRMTTERMLTECPKPCRGSPGADVGIPVRRGLFCLCTAARSTQGVLKGYSRGTQGALKGYARHITCKARMPTSQSRMCPAAQTSDAAGSIVLTDSLRRSV
jgi:hypothetical protein